MRSIQMGCHFTIPYRESDTPNFLKPNVHFLSFYFQYCSIFFPASSSVRLNFSFNFFIVSS